MIRILAYAFVLAFASRVSAQQKYIIKNSSDLPEVEISRLLLAEDIQGRNVQKHISYPFVKTTFPAVATNVEIPVDVVKSVSPTSADLAIWAIRNSNYYSTEQQVALLQAIEKVKRSEPLSQIVQEA